MEVPLLVLFQTPNHLTPHQERARPWAQRRLLAQTPEDLRLCGLYTVHLNAAGTEQSRSYQQRWLIDRLVVGQTEPLRGGGVTARSSYGFDAALAAGRHELRARSRT